MDVFDLDRALLADYARFARSFTQIRAPDILQQVEEIYASDHFWPEPLISINPHFERGSALTELVGDGSLPAALGARKLDAERLFGPTETSPEGRMKPDQRWGEDQSGSKAYFKEDHFSGGRPSAIAFIRSARRVASAAGSGRIFRLLQ